MSETTKAEPKAQEGVVVTQLDEIKFTEANKSMAVLAWIPLIGLILMFVEKNDKFVRYNGAQSTIIGIFQLIYSIIAGALSVALWFLWGVFGLLGTVVMLGVAALVIYGMFQTLNGKRFDIPVISKWALKLMDMIK